MEVLEREVRTGEKEAEWVAVVGEVQRRPMRLGESQLKLWELLVGAIYLSIYLSIFFFAR
jgi:hypothetical protein